MKRIKKLLLIVTMATIAFLGISTLENVVNPQVAEASAGKAFKDGAGITSSKDSATATKDITKDLNKIVILVITIAGLWSILWLVIGGMMLQGSSGNPQKRSGAIGCLVCTGVGIVIIVKAYDIAGYMAGLGT
ncbi:hypothetical protein D5E69_23260 (plasmid) [Rossellomorea marisflavi]|uniref:hypothetical protein n=1 Tax=Rossellomorea marisflavi TaxID=189381 RepID=UPI00131805DC|nr:hypothetical protein [Rossellomorea marisflavi]QHA38752.1 hypothetical protein D5E69_23260 [Rossellomorea marisflavi]